MLRVDPATGKTRWHKDWIGERIHRSGKFLCVARAKRSGVEHIAAAMNDTSAPTHFRVYRLDHATGNELWDYHQPKPAASLEPRPSRRLLQDGGEVKVLKFLAL